MVRRTNYFGLVGMSAALVVGCSNGSNGNPDGSPGNDVVGGDTNTGAHTYTYVMDQLTIDPTDDPSVAHTGYNLDNLFSTVNDMNGCSHQDFFSTTDNDQNCPMAAVMNGTCAASAGTMGCMGGPATCAGGVDNQLPTLANTLMSAANTDIRMTFANLVNTNRLALIVRVTGITDDTNSSNVTVKIYLGYPTFSTNCTGGVPANPVYSVSQSSITATGTTIEDAAYSFPGHIVNGRLEATANAGGQFLLPLPPIMGHQIVLPLNAVQFRGNITQASLQTASLGGWVHGTDVIAAVTAIAPMYAMIVGTVIGGLIDIEDTTTMVCDDEMSMPHRYGGISLGLGLHGVPATISTTTPIAPMAAPGTCGASTSDGGNG